MQERRWGSVELWLRRQYKGLLLLLLRKWKGFQLRSLCFLQSVLISFYSNLFFFCMYQYKSPWFTYLSLTNSLKLWKCSQFHQHLPCTTLGCCVSSFHINFGNIPRFFTPCTCWCLTTWFWVNFLNIVLLPESSLLFWFTQCWPPCSVVHALDIQPYMWGEC